MSEGFKIDVQKSYEIGRLRLDFIKMGLGNVWNQFHLDKVFQNWSVKDLHDFRMDLSNDPQKALALRDSIVILGEAGKLNELEKTLVRSGIIRNIDNVEQLAKVQDGERVIDRLREGKPAVAFRDGSTISRNQVLVLSALRDNIIENRPELPVRADRELTFNLMRAASNTINPRPALMVQEGMTPGLDNSKIDSAAAVINVLYNRGMGKVYDGGKIDYARFDRLVSDIRVGVELVALGKRAEMSKAFGIDLTNEVALLKAGREIGKQIASGKKVENVEVVEVSSGKRFVFINKEAPEGSSNLQMGIFSSDPKTIATVNISGREAQVNFNEAFARALPKPMLEAITAFLLVPRVFGGDAMAAASGFAGRIGNGQQLNFVFPQNLNFQELCKNFEAFSKSDFSKISLFNLLQSFAKRLGKLLSYFSSDTQETALSRWLIAVREMILEQGESTKQAIKDRERGEVRAKLELVLKDIKEASSKPVVLRQSEIEANERFKRSQENAKVTAVDPDGKRQGGGEEQREDRENKGEIVVRDPFFVTQKDNAGRMAIVWRPSEALRIDKVKYQARVSEAIDELISSKPTVLEVTFESVGDLREFYRLAQAKLDLEELVIGRYRFEKPDLESQLPRLIRTIGQGDEARLNAVLSKMNSPLTLKLRAKAPVVNEEELFISASENLALSNNIMRDLSEAGRFLGDVSEMLSGFERRFEHGLELEKSEILRLKEVVDDLRLQRNALSIYLTADNAEQKKDVEHFLKLTDDYIMKAHTLVMAFDIEENEEILSIASSERVGATPAVSKAAGNVERILVNALTRGMSIRLNLNDLLTGKGKFADKRTMKIFADDLLAFLKINEDLIRNAEFTELKKEVVRGAGELLRRDLFTPELKRQLLPFVEPKLSTPQP